MKISLIKNNHFYKKPTSPSFMIQKLKKILNYFNNKITEVDIAILFRQLSTLITANIPIVQGCHILSQSQEKIELQQLINKIKNEMESGKSLATSLRKFPAYFDEMVCNTIYTGEQAGTLDIMLNKVADYKENALKLKNQVKQALFYPIFILITALVVSSIMLIFVVPRFAELFQSMHGNLPVFTQIVINISQLLREYVWVIIILTCSFPILIYYFNTSVKWQRFYDHFILKVPILNHIIKKIILIRFTKSLAITFHAGTSITESLHMIALMSGNHAYTQAIFTLKNHVLTGQQLHMAMQLNPLFSSISVQMVKIGEESGTLPTMLEKIAELYTADIDYLITNLTRLLEPLIMIILGVLIGGLVVAMYLPIFKLGTII